jgi:hypothetical protein
MASSEPAFFAGPGKEAEQRYEFKSKFRPQTLPAGSRNDRNHAGRATLCAVQVNNRHADVHEVVDGGVEFQAGKPGDGTAELSVKPTAGVPDSLGAGVAAAYGAC